MFVVVPAVLFVAVCPKKREDSCAGFVTEEEKTRRERESS